MYLYQPNSVLVPVDTKSVRVMPATATFSEDKLERTDKRTVFYDVFVDGQSRKLRATGPKLFNLKKELFPLRIFVNGNPISYRLDEIHRLIFLESEHGVGQFGNELVIEFRFKLFTKKIRLHWHSIELKLRDYKRTPISITTLQKDNCFEWIRDWIRWHCRLYDVGRLILYDNGSSNRDELISRLRSLEGELKIIFVEWNFPHGVNPYKYAQYGSLNHARLVFPVPKSYCINLDVDEYLVKHGDGNLLEYLKQKLAKPELGAVVFTQYLVPNISDSHGGKVPRCFDFPYRFRNIGKPSGVDSWSTISRMKYIYRFDRVGYNAVHRIASEKNRMFSSRYGLLHKMRFYAKKILREAFGKFVGDKLPKVRIDASHVPVNEMFFFHFLGLNTGWRNDPMNAASNFNSEFHIEEPLIAELAERADLIQSPDR